MKASTSSNGRIYPGWWQLVIAMLAQAICGGSIFTAYSVIAEPLKASFEPSNMVLMLSITVTSLASGLLSPSLGAAIDRFSIRKLMLLGVALVAAGFFLLSLSGSMVQVLLIYAACMAAASVLLGPIATSALLARWFTHKRAMAMGIAASGSAIGGLIFPPLLQFFIDTLEWRLALQVFAGLILVVSLPPIALLAIDRPDSDTSVPADQNPTVSAIPVTHALKDPTFWVIVLIIGALFCGPIAIISNLIQMVGGKGIVAAQGALLISIFSASNFAGKLIFAGIADRLNRTLLLVCTLLGVVSGVLGLANASTFSLLAIYCAVTGLFAGFTTPLWSLLLSQVYGSEILGKMMGLMSLCIMPLTLTSPPLFGWVFDISGSYNNALLGYAVFLVLALPLTKLVGSATARSHQEGAIYEASA